MTTPPLAASPAGTERKCDCTACMVSMRTPTREGRSNPAFSSSSLTVTFRLRDIEATSAASTRYPFRPAPCAIFASVPSSSRSTCTSGTSSASLWHTAPPCANTKLIKFTHCAANAATCGEPSASAPPSAHRRSVDISPSHSDSHRTARTRPPRATWVSSARWMTYTAWDSTDAGEVELTLPGAPSMRTKERSSSTADATGIEACVDTFVCVPPVDVPRPTAAPSELASEKTSTDETPEL